MSLLPASTLRAGHAHAVGCENNECRKQRMRCREHSLFSAFVVVWAHGYAARAGAVVNGRSADVQKAADRCWCCGDPHLSGKPRFWLMI